MVVLNLFQHTQNLTKFSAGEIIFQAGEQGDEMYVVREGAVEIRLGEQVLEVVQTGGIIGEMVMIGAPTRTATAVAKQNCRLVAVKSDQFRYMVQETPYFAEWILGILVKRVMKMNRMAFPAEVTDYTI
jgi:CRP/FNR family transcriptional regulator, cyclic AMP receptor protein